MDDRLNIHSAVKRAAFSKVVEEQTRRREIARAVVSEPTKRAMKRGREGYKWLTADKIHRDVFNAVIDGETKRQPDPTAAWAPQDLHPMLDIRSLRPRPRVATSHVLRWLSTDAIEAAQIFVALIGKPGAEELWVSGSWGMGAPIRQRIQLEYGDRRRHLYMICPVLKTRCLRLYFRGGFFASAKAHRLAKVRRRFEPKTREFRQYITEWRETPHIPRRRGKAFEGLV